MRAIASARRGRPKRAIGANDNEAPGSDRGTPELQMQRALLTRGADPAASTQPLDLLHAKGWIGCDEQAAGLRYAALYRRLHGRGNVSYGRFYEGFTGGGPSLRGGDEDDLVRAELRYRAAKAELAAAGARAQRVTDAICVLGCWPGWLFAKTGATHGDCRLLRVGIAALQAGFSRARFATGPST